jgi:hypothetical protein
MNKNTKASELALKDLLELMELERLQRENQVEFGQLI